MKKILITGSNGLLGQTLIDVLLYEEDYTIIGFSRGNNRSGRNDFEYVTVNLTNEKELTKEVLKYKPDVIINTAAITQVDFCEDNKEECDKINVELVKNLVRMAEELNLHIIHISTDFIFDGNQGYYKETDKSSPLNYYGLSKLKAEKILINSAVQYTILRTILVYGKVYDMSRSNVVLWIRKMLTEKKEIGIVDDQYRMPTYVADLAKACQLVIEKNATGIFNVSSNELLSIYEIAQQIAETFELDTSLIKNISSKTLNQRAKRPPKTGFDLTKTKKILGLKPNSFKEDLQRFKKKLN